MTQANSTAKLYTPRLLSLSAQLAAFPLIGDFQKTAEVRSRTCGSTITLGINLDAGGRITKIGMLVSACAIGQSSAAVLAMAAEGRSAHDFAQAHGDIEQWLSGEGAPPEWPGFDALEPALPHPGRHGALMLPWQAVMQAFSNETRQA